jgi:hypothetical protein
MNVIVCTTKEKLLHKQDKLEGDPDKSTCGQYYWYFWNIPKMLKIGDKFYVATEGFIRGYFLVHAIDKNGAGDGQVVFKSRSWHDITPIPRKHFQGFSYCNEEYK